MNPLVQRVLSRSDVRAVARAATLIENRAPQATDLLRALFLHTGQARVIGITGPPGAGKSTLVSQLIGAFRALNKRVGVIAVDPSSPLTGGAILGDRVRMLEHHTDNNVFIRSLATRGALGGLASATLDLVLLLDAAGFDPILIETVGVGQDEVDIAQVAGTVVVVLVPNMGDDVQAIKAGILEIASVLVINKADLDGAEKLERELDAFSVPVCRTVATTGAGVAELVAALPAAPGPDTRSVWESRLRVMLRERLEALLPAAELSEAASRVARREQDPYAILDNWMEHYFSRSIQR